MTVQSATGSSALAAMGASTSVKKDEAADSADRFLKLLVTQLKNQDPLNPMDNAQVTTQMAQINTVEGINKLNTTLSTMAMGFNAGQTLQAAGMVGRRCWRKATRCSSGRAAPKAATRSTRPPTVSR